uniref:Uncharacterized protein n=1 Tax=viral metagenome TaxID=1070528 RepID=A0A6C0HK06_9ZZZZ
MDKGREATGFIAQEVLELIEATHNQYTRLVNTDDKNQYTVSLINMIPIMVKYWSMLSKNYRPVWKF